MLIDDDEYTSSVPLTKAMVFTDESRLSRQIADERYGPSGYNGRFIKPTYDPQTWASLLTQSSRLSRAIRVLARNTVGLGYHFTPYRPEDELTDAEKVRFERESRMLEKLFSLPNPEQSTPELFECLKIDEEATGDWWLEVTRDRRGRINGLYHVPSTTMRITEDGSKYLQARRGGTAIIHFVPFGAKNNIDPKSGERKRLAWNKRASEIVHRRIYTPDDDWYGAPRFVSAAAAIASTRLSQQWNINFLRNSAHLPYAVIVEGGNLNHDSRVNIQSFIDREGKGVQNAGRVLLLEPELEHVPNAMRGSVKIRLEKIAVGLTDDGSFLKLREADNEEVRESLGTAKIMLGTFTDANKSNALIALRVTVQQEIIPDILRKEHTINNTIVRDMGARVARFNFVRPKVLDSLQEAVLVQKLMTSCSVNELRGILSELRGKRLAPIDNELARVPLAFFQRPEMLESAESLISQINTRTKELTADPPDITLKKSQGENSLLPDNIVNLIPDKAV